MNVTATTTAAPATTRRKILPGFGITMGYSVLYLSLVVLLPLSALLFNSTGLSWAKFWDVATDPRVLASYRVSLSTAAAAAFVDAILGLLLAWVLVRYEFPGKRIFDALIDLPFALPTAVAGVSLTALYATNGWIGAWLEPLGLKVAFTPLGITLALMFIGIPFVVRTVQPVLEDLDRDMEEALSNPWCRPLENLSFSSIARVVPSAVNRLCFGICPWYRRIWLSRVHLR